MKTKIKLLALIIIASTFVSINKVSAQGCFSGLIGGPNHTEVQSANALLDFTLEPGINPCNTTAGGLLTGVGINQANPAYIFDILGNYVGDGVNVSAPAIGAYPKNAVGYSIGGDGSNNMFLWHSGDSTSVYCGILAGFLFPNVAFTAATSYSNTVVGYQADENFDGVGGSGNCAFGAYALQLNAGGNANMAIGTQALQVNVTGSGNSAIGHAAMWHNKFGSSNVAVGENSLYHDSMNSYNVAVGCEALFNDKASYNTASGFSSGYHITTGTYNVAAGYNSLYNDTTYSFNVALGVDALFNNEANYNTATGFYAGANLSKGTENTASGYGAMQGTAGGDSGSYNVANGVVSLEELSSGDSNTAVGYGALLNVNRANGDVALGYDAGILTNVNSDNLFLGTQADEDPFMSSPINNAAAIGYHAITPQSNDMVLGNNNQQVTIGLSDVIPGPPTRLELSTQHGAGSFTVTASSTPPAYINHALGTGWSGLRFDDLTAAHSVPTRNPGAGVLGVDSSGNVIYVLDTLTSPPANIGNCSVPTVISANDGVFDLATNNASFYFQGNRSRRLNNEDVLIGYTDSCPSVYIPAKLSVKQASQVTPTSPQSSIGLYVENDDLGLSVTAPVEPVIGIQSIVPNPHDLCYSIAGLFDAPGNNVLCSANYAIIVPNGGGYSGLNTSMPIAPLQVDGEIYDSGYTYIRDSDFARKALVVKNLSTTLPYNWGISSLAQNSTVRNVGIFTQASNSTTGVHNIGIYAKAPYDFSLATTNWAAVFNGDCYQTGSFSTGIAVIYSDSTIKRNVDSFSNAISIIKTLNPRTYYYTTSNNYGLQLDTFMHYGFIAQQLQRSVPCMVRKVVTPELLDTAGNVTTPSSTINAVDYNQFAAILTAAFQEQQQISYNDSVTQKKTNDSLRYTLDSLRRAFQNIQNCLNTLCIGIGDAPVHHSTGNGNSGDSNATITNTQDVMLSASSDAPLLYQNIPNPFSTGTKINYYLPEGTIGATMVFYDTYGNQIKTVPLSQTGNGTLNITPDNLSAGIYSYSLEAV